MNPATLEAPGSIELTQKKLIDETLWSRLTARIRQNHEFQAQFGELSEAEQVDWSERILNETLGFLKLCSLHVGTFGPSPLVDIGWHTFMLYSRPYTDFCEKLNGGYIHHEPSDDPTMFYEDHPEMSTTDVMVLHGIAVDAELWGHSRPLQTGDGQLSRVEVSGKLQERLQSSCKG